MLLLLTGHIIRRTTISRFLERF